MPRFACSAALALFIAGCPSSPNPGSDAPGLDAPTPALDVPGLDAPRPDVPVPASCLGPTRTGEATYYTFADGTGNCGFAASTDFVAALNDPDWEGSALCGACAEVTGPSGTVTLRIVDRCPECASGDLDLSPAAFDQIAERALGRVAITWHEVPCEAPGPLVFHVDYGANPYYLAVNVRSHRHRVVRVERRLGDGGWVDFVRQDYNVWVESPVTGAPVDVMHLRATDSHGGTVEADVPVAPPDTDVPAGAQLPEC